MSWVASLFSGLAKLVPVRIRWARRTAKRILRTETDTFPECELHVEEQERPLFLPTKKVVIHKHPDGEMTIKDLFD